jgi:hypothetical protein
MVSVGDEEGDHRDVGVEHGEQVVADARLRIDDGAIAESHLKADQMAAKLRGGDERADRQRHGEPYGKLASDRPREAE